MENFFDDEEFFSDLDMLCMKHDIELENINELDEDWLNSLIPKMYYPNGKFVTVTKRDLIHYLNGE